MRKATIVFITIIVGVILLCGIFIGLVPLLGKRFYSEKQVVAAYNNSSPEISVIIEFVENKLKNKEEFELTIYKEMDYETNSYNLYGPETPSVIWITTGDISVDEAIRKLLLTDSIFDQLTVYDGVITLQTDEGSLDFANGIIYYCKDMKIKYEDTYTVVHKKILDKTYYFESDVNKARKNGYSLPEKYRATTT